METLRIEKGSFNREWIPDKAVAILPLAGRHSCVHCEMSHHYNIFCDFACSIKIVHIVADQLNNMGLSFKKHRMLGTKSTNVIPDDSHGSKIDVKVRNTNVIRQLVVVTAKY